MSSEAKKHPFHILNPSPWPFVGSVSATLLAIGAVSFFHDEGGVLMSVGFLGVLATMWFWWRDVLREAHRDNAHTPEVQFGFKMGITLFIISELMFFVAWFWAFFNGYTGNSPSITSWPPEGIEPLHTWGLPFINTIILVISGVFVEVGHKGLLTGNRAKAKFGVLVAFLLGVVFLCLQVYEYTVAQFAFSDGLYSSVFYMATGFHGFHVFVGAVCLLVTWFRLNAGHFDEKQHIGFLATSWYWHFVDIVWIFLFVWVYWIGNAAFYA